MRVPYVLPRNSDQFPLAVGQRVRNTLHDDYLGVDEGQTRGFGTGARDVTVALPDRVTLRFLTK